MRKSRAATAESHGARAQERNFPYDTTPRNQTKRKRAFDARVNIKVGLREQRCVPMLLEARYFEHLGPSATAILIADGQHHDETRIAPKLVPPRGQTGHSPS